MLVLESHVTPWNTPSCNFAILFRCTLISCAFVIPENTPVGNSANRLSSRFTECNAGWIPKMLVGRSGSGPVPSDVRRFSLRSIVVSAEILVERKPSSSEVRKLSDKLIILSDGKPWKTVDGKLAIRFPLRITC